LGLSVWVWAVVGWGWVAAGAAFGWCWWAVGGFAGWGWVAWLGWLAAGALWLLLLGSGCVPGPLLFFLIRVSQLS